MNRKASEVNFPEAVNPTAARFAKLRAIALRVIDSGIPPDMQSNPEMLRRARAVLGFAMVLIVLEIECAWFFDRAIGEKSLPIDIAVFVGLLMTLAIPISFRRTGTTEVGLNLGLGASFIVMVTAFTLLGGINSPVLHWMAVIPMISVLMGSRREASIWALTIIGTLTVLILADAFGPSFANHLELTQAPRPMLWAQSFLGVASWTFVLMAIAAVFERHQRKHSIQIADKKVELESEVELRKQAEERSLYLAYHDELTTLPNRRLFKENLGRAMHEAHRNDRQLAVLFLDLDGFKGVNDTYGHGLGDELLQAVAARLRNCVRMSDSLARGRVTEQEVVSRLGGDEFTILIERIRHHREAGTVAERVLHSLAEPFELGEHEVYITVSIGIAIFSKEDEDMDELLRNADLAMYHAKDVGRANYQFFEESMNADIIRRSTIANDLRRGLLSDEFVLYYQVIVAAHTHQILGVEALIRWNHPEKGLVFPDAFIDVAEETGLITRIGDWTIWRCCQQLQKWRASGVAPPRISINVSSVQFRSGSIVGTISEALRSCFIPPECIVLEFTEHAILSDAEETSRCLNELTKLGVGIALDDFGTGYSSLSYAKRFPVTSLKIDRSFVMDMEVDADDLLPLIAQGKITPGR